MMTKFIKKHTLLLVLTSSLLTACATVPNEQTVNWKTANHAIVAQHIVPRYQLLADTTKTLEKQARTLCRVPIQESLDKMREGFYQAMDAWQGVQHIRNGPVELFTRYHRLQLWPDKHNTGAKQLSKMLAEEDRSLLTPERFRKTSVAVQGFSALERLLFKKGIAPTVFLGTMELNYRCSLVEAISHNLSTMSEGLVEDWSATEPPFHMLFISSGETLDTNQDSEQLAGKLKVTANFFNNINTQIQSVINQKLERPMAASAARAKPRYAESWRSLHSMKNIVVNLQAVESLYTVGFKPLLLDKPDGDVLNQQIQQAFATVFTTANEIEQPLEEAVKNQTARPALERLVSANRELLKLLIGPLPQALNIPFSFNALDGD